MKETALFFNGDYHLQKPLTFKELYEMPFGEVSKIFYGRYASYRSNLGTYLFGDALARNIDADWVTSSDFEYLKEKKPKALVTTWFHAITPRTFIPSLEYWGKFLSLDIKIVPMVCGFRYKDKNDFNLNEKRIITTLFSQIAERSEIGVRGESSADFLNSLGIKNVRIVGCPSLFYYMKREQKVNFSRTKKISMVNICTDFSPEQKLLLEKFIKFSLQISNDIKQFKCSLQIHPFEELFYKFGHHRFIENTSIKDILLKYGNYYFSVDDWVEGLKNYEFTLSTRFHGGVASVLADTPTIFITTDNRMEELCTYHKLPYVRLSHFDNALSLQHYYELADYTYFNNNYAAAFDQFLDYCRKNDVRLKIDKTDKNMEF